MLWLQAPGPALVQSLEVDLHQALALTLHTQAKTPLEVSCVQPKLQYAVPVAMCMTFLHAWRVTS